VFGRTSNGKHTFDATEIRSAFALSEDLPERIRLWRDERIWKITAGDTPVSTVLGPCIVLHVIPLSSMGVGSEILEAEQLAERPNWLSPMRGGGLNYRINLDGFVVYGAGGGETSYCYCQAFRSGRIESVRGGIAHEKEKVKFMAFLVYERELIRSAWRYMQGLIDIGIDYPMIVSVSMAGMREVRIVLDEQEYSEPIDRDTIVLPEILIESPPKNLPRQMRPLLDAAWNACGLPKSRSFDHQGHWVGELLGDVPHAE
jgi:hypothetical protein